jgi:hypothetical protein
MRAHNSGASPCGGMPRFAQSVELIDAPVVFAPELSQTCRFKLRSASGRLAKQAALKLAAITILNQVYICL